jgi:hypothetical protein
MGPHRPDALLIGENQQDDSSLSRCLRKRGCDCRFAASRREAYDLIGTHSFDLVLGPTRLDGESLHPLIRRMDGSDSTLFYFQPVEDGCWWLPALLRGRSCFGAPALRSSEFVTVLDEVIQEIRVGTPAIAKGKTPAAVRFLVPVSVAAAPGELGMKDLVKAKAAGY